MTATTVLSFNANQDPVFKFFKNTVSFSNKNAYQRFSSIVEPGFDFNQEIHIDDNTMNFISDDTKVFMTLYNGMYHFWHDSVANFIYQFKKTPDALFIFDTINLHEPDDLFIKFFQKLLISKNVNYRFIKTNSDIDIVANNFYVQTSINDEVDGGNIVFDFVSDYIKNKEVKPFRKVYLSRSHMGSRNYEDIWFDGPSFKNDNRIYNEKILEDFLITLGFEIIKPELDFDTIEDQINYFYETKTIVHPTGGAGTNAMFMQPGSNVVEIVNTMCVSTYKPDPEINMSYTEEALHHFYAALSFNKNHNYFAIQNKTREPELIIDKIQNDKVIKALFEEL